MQTTSSDSPDPLVDTMLLESNIAIETPRKVRFAPKSPHHRAQKHSLQKGDKVEEDGCDGVEMQKQLSSSEPSDTGSLDPPMDMLLENTVVESPRKVKFAPKTPQRIAQNIGSKNSESANVEDCGGVRTRLQKLLCSSKHAAAQTKLAFGYGDEVLSVISYGSPKDGMSNNGKYRLPSVGGVSFSSDGPEKEYSDLWSCTSQGPLKLPLRRPCTGNPDLLNEEEFGDTSESFIKDEHSIKPAAELDLEVSPGSNCVFAQDVLAINTDEKHCCTVGELGNRVIITPDADSILKDMQPSDGMQATSSSMLNQKKVSLQAPHVDKTILPLPLEASSSEGENLAANSLLPLSCTDLVGAIPESPLDLPSPSKPNAAATIGMQNSQGAASLQQSCAKDPDIVLKDQLHFDHDHSTSKPSNGGGANSSAESLSECSLPDLAGAKLKSPGSVSSKPMFSAAIGNRVIVDPYADLALTPMDQMYANQINYKLARLARRRFIIAGQGVGPEVQERLDVLDKESQHLEQFLLRVKRMRVQQFAWPSNGSQHPYYMDTPMLKVPRADISRSGTNKKTYKSAKAVGHIEKDLVNDSKQEVKNAPSVGQPDGQEAVDEVAGWRAQTIKRSGLKRSRTEPTHPKQIVKTPRYQAIHLHSTLEKVVTKLQERKSLCPRPTSNASMTAVESSLPATFNSNNVLHDASNSEEEKEEEEVFKTSAVKAEGDAATSTTTINPPLPSPNKADVHGGAPPIFMLSGAEIGYLVDYMDYTFSVIDE